MTKHEKIIWDDAGSFGYEGETWHLISEIEDTYAKSCFINNSYGVVVWENETDLILVQSITDEEKGDQSKYANPIRIPKTLIVDRIKFDD